jgi:L-glyceraldehyde 3-phosphate reductase
MKYNRCGKSGLLLPQISLGLWHNFGSVDSFDNAESIAKTAFDKGITHFDLANNYGPVPGSAETNFGKILKNNFQGNLRDEIVISTKAGYGMWAGPYGDWGSRKYLLSSLDQSLKRMDLDYVDIFYSHRFDPETPLEETMMALDYAVRSGKALYAGISNYPPEQTAEAAAILKQLGTPCLIHQVKYSMFVRTPEEGLLDVLGEKGIGCIAFSPLAQGLLTDRYLKGIPENSRASNPNGFLKAEDITEEKIQIIVALNDIAQSRNQSLAQMALAWLLKDNRITSVLIGASSVGQLQNNIDALGNIDFTQAELDKIEAILASV